MKNLPVRSDLLPILEAFVAFFALFQYAFRQLYRGLIMMSFFTPSIYRPINLMSR